MCARATACWRSARGTGWNSALLAERVGPRRLWNEVDTAHRWWLSAGKPTPQQNELTVSPDGTHAVRLDTPTGPHRWSVAA
ncbi:hypothetical protein [Actinopolyspora saharensis]|uniref:hypothetical protein n=1 Tax=Actinopolyspora saharensis TaxID=995062 RepID=UPI003F664FA6